jgi:4-amino-4-deoxy-L-arabinose transferase-like glycosyltransferase
MYVTALALSIARPTDYESILSVSRSLSIAAGSVAILLTFVLARRWFGMSTALLSAAILAASPYFLGFSRLAMTEGDAFCPAAVLLVLLAFDRYRWRRDSSSIVLLALAFGIALASKFLLVCLFAPLILCVAPIRPAESAQWPGRATGGRWLAWADG